jgi:hypothetical protein
MYFIPLQSIDLYVKVYILTHGIMWYKYNYYTFDQYKSKMHTIQISWDITNVHILTIYVFINNIYDVLHNKRRLFYYLPLIGFLQNNHCIQCIKLYNHIKRETNNWCFCTLFMENDWHTYARACLICVHVCVRLWKKQGNEDILQIVNEYVCDVKLWVF